MTPNQVAVNAAAVRNLAARLERLGYTGDAQTEAEQIAIALVADGYRRVEKPPPPRGPGCSDEAREAAMTQIRDTLRRSRP